jgi:hypothetical protein
MHQTSKRYVVNSPGSANDRYKAGLDDYLTSVAAQTALLANKQRAFS